jgi:coenzyme F420-reducing hydrogenase delta subunit
MNGKKIIGYVCRLNAVVSAGLGSPAKLDDNIKIEIVELPCAGKIDVLLLLSAFEQGADAVFAAVCPEHECMNITGSTRARKRIEHAKSILDKIGIGGERLVMYNVSGVFGPRFADISKDMAELLEKLGESPLCTKERNQLK